MHRPCPITVRTFSLFGLCVCCGLAFGFETKAQTAPKPPGIVAPLTEKDGLKVSISATYHRGAGIGGFGYFVDASSSLELSPRDPHINVVLQNTSSKPLNIFDEGSSAGAFQLTLQITKIDKKTLDTPLIVAKEVMGWGGNVPSARSIEPSEAIVREVHLHVPAHILDPKAPATDADFKDRGGGPLYWKFPVPNKGEEHQITISAVFANASPVLRCPGVEDKAMWTGQIASVPTDYRVYWGWGGV